jgi:hypothetical protein
MVEQDVSKGKLHRRDVGQEERRALVEGAMSLPGIPPNRGGFTDIMHGEHAGTSVFLVRTRTSEVLDVFIMANRILHMAMSSEHPGVKEFATACLVTLSNFAETLDGMERGFATKRQDSPA